MKTWDKSLMKMSLTNDKIKMEIKISDLVYLFHNSPSNFDGDEPFAKVKKGKRQEFATYVIERLLDDTDSESDTVVWGEQFERIFESLTESCEDFLKYSDDELDGDTDDEGEDDEE